ncbi:MAG: hypothetical protein ACFFCS_22640 [Candidatus Hodarchaeota archaeon]
MSAQDNDVVLKPFYIVKGIFSTAPVILFVILIPQFLNIFLDIGLDNESLYIIASIIPLSLILTPLALLKTRVRYVLLVIFMYLAGFFSFFSATILQVTWSGNQPSAVVIALFFLSSGITAYLFPLTMKQELSRLLDKPMLYANVAFYILGVVIFCGSTCIINIFTQSYSWILYGIGVVFVLMPVGLNKVLEKQSSEKHELNGMGRTGYSLQFLSIFLGSFNVTFMFSAIIATFKGVVLTWAILGILIGLSITIPMIRNKILMAPLYLSISFFLFIPFSTFLKLYSMPGSMVVIGILMGFYIGDLLRALSYFPVIKKAKLGGWFFLFLMGAIAASALGNLYLLNVENTPEVNEIGFYLISLVVANGLTCAFLGVYFVHKARRIERMREVHK